MYILTFFDTTRFKVVMTINSRIKICLREYRKRSNSSK